MEEYEYFLGEFANAEGKKGGQFYTPKAIVKLMVEMIEPYKGRVYDPACGSGGMFVMSEKFVTEHQGTLKILPSMVRKATKHLEAFKDELSYQKHKLRVCYLEYRRFISQDAHPGLKQITF